MDSRMALSLARSLGRARERGGDLAVVCRESCVCRLLRCLASGTSCRSARALNRPQPRLRGPTSVGRSFARPSNGGGSRIQDAVIRSATGAWSLRDAARTSGQAAPRGSPRCAIRAGRSSSNQDAGACICVDIPTAREHFDQHQPVPAGAVRRWLWRVQTPGPDAGVGDSTRTCPGGPHTTRHPPKRDRRVGSKPARHHDPVWCFL